MVNQRRGGTIFLAVNGERQDAKGAFTYNLGEPMRTGIVGADAPHGFKEEQRVPFIEGKITDRGTLNVKALQRTTDATVTLQLANGKTVVLREAWWAGEGTVSTEEGEIDCRFEGMAAEEY